MFVRHLVLLTALAACGAAAGAGAEALPARAAGTFEQRKTLADVGVTLVSRGTFVFERGRSFTWHTRTPVESVFRATPTNWAFTVNGRTATHALATDISSIGQIFTVREVAEFVKEVRTEPKEAFPSRVTVDFKNGDRLAVALYRE